MQVFSTQSKFLLSFILLLVSSVSEAAFKITQLNCSYTDGFSVNLEDMGTHIHQKVSLSDGYITHVKGTTLTSAYGTVTVPMGVSQANFELMFNKGIMTAFSHRSEKENLIFNTKMKKKMKDPTVRKLFGHYDSLRPLLLEAKSCCDDKNINRCLGPLRSGIYQPEEPAEAR